MKKNIYTGKNSQIGQYFSKDLEFVSYNISNLSTWEFLNHTKNLFFIVPKTPNTMEDSKRFVLSAREAGVEHIVKIGSLGPWRVIHNQLNQFIQSAGIVCSNINIAPLMNNIFTEQYNKETGVLLNYRHQTPAPYLDPQALAQLIRFLMDQDNPTSQSINATGIQQYFIKDVQQALESNGYPVHSIENTHNDKLHKNPSLTPDQQLMTELGNDYERGLYPLVDNILWEEFCIGSRTLEEFIQQDQKYYEKNFAEDKNL
jgi:hypothetical protein